MMRNRSGNMVRMIAFTIHASSIKTYIVTFVRLATRNDNGVKVNVLRLEIFQNSFTVNFVDGFIDNRKAGIVSFGMNTSCLQHLQIRWIQERSTRNHVDVVRNWQGVDIPPSFRRRHDSFLGRHCSRCALFYDDRFAGGSFRDFEHILWGPFEGSKYRFRSRIRVDFNKGIVLTLGIAARALFKAVVRATGSHIRFGSTCLYRTRFLR